MSRVSNKLKQCKPYEFNNILSKDVVKFELAKLQKDFVLLPVDKAAKNISIICKRYYIDVMTNEIEKSPTFQYVSDNKDTFIGDLKSTTSYNLDNDNLPYLYATSKMHKSPKKFRFITAAKDTAISGTSILVSKCLKLLMKTAHTSFTYRIKEVDNCVFVVDNRDKVINFLNKSNQNKVARKCISTWDFTTLYTKIPHNKLKDKVTTFVNKIFEGVFVTKGAKFINCSMKSRTAYFSKSASKTKGVTSLSCDELIELISFVIDNSYIVYHGKVFRQVIGIPMGTNCAPFLANIFLHVYEYEYLKMLVDNGDIEIAKKLSNMFRYQDDCVAINDDGTFAKHHKNIYPPEMVLESTNTSKCVCTFLDLRISVFRGTFKFRSYDKRNDFKFQINNYPNLKGNIPYSTAYGVYASQLVRFCDINQELNPFISDVKVMTNKLLDQGFNISMLHNMFLKFSNKYLFKWGKYGSDIISHCNKLFNLVPK